MYNSNWGYSDIKEKGNEIGDKFLHAFKQYTKVKSLSVNGLLTYSFKMPEDHE